MSTPTRNSLHHYNHYEILKKCIELFYNKKLEDVKSDEISQHCGYSKKTIYAYFKSKEDIYKGVQTMCITNMIDDLKISKVKNIDDFIDFIFNYNTIYKENTYHITKKVYSKYDLSDHALFIDKFKPFITFISEKLKFTSPSPDICIIIWHIITNGLTNDTDIIKVKKMVNAILDLEQ